MNFSTQKKSCAPIPPPLTPRFFIFIYLLLLLLFLRFMIGDLIFVLVLLLFLLLLLLLLLVLLLRLSIEPNLPLPLLPLLFLLFIPLLLRLLASAAPITGMIDVSPQLVFGSTRLRPLILINDGYTCDWSRPLRLTEDCRRCRGEVDIGGARTNWRNDPPSDRLHFPTSRIDG